ncbi:4-(cytidine 5'-diphospho)-2-C-methyl-D-erythritol kinase [Sphingomonas sp. AOB5]|uniref:4-(cytidine 5'-diphospho)-2-C-methyl-D-erythritol kinase n=1 Tax=Sphingomonas sp. AOB5 TaxID=3034017 RepID=UPI0023F9F318|nr:4-(cytidine 5'-diphospho)-2-C-methyl-D-erythritol kinase [Sphingomonas sp. AOB5]MDF7777820.1 4-(cytidine 5'-diphospho)-2-C-methyl-D-erythritol kinase [Sphingomonas sp. AOB5]
MAGFLIAEAAPAKLNLALHVRARRPDGYHELETLFAFVEAGDVVRIGEGDGFSVTGPFAGALAGEGDNLVTRAAASFAATFGGGPWRIELEKHLPVASGIGGGSADAAATLRALARLQGVPLDDTRLFACADALGSDVPACLLGRTAIGRGRGEQLVPIDGAPGVPVLLVNPLVPVPTAAVFKAWDGVDRGPLPEGGMGAIVHDGRNDLEPPARGIAPEIDEVLDVMAGQPGAMVARMSGSGATCFALFERAEDCEAAKRAMWPDWWSVATALI